MIRRTRPILLVLGPAGAGKSTLGRSLAALGFQHLEFDVPPGDGRHDAATDAVSEGLDALARSARVGPLALAIEATKGHLACRGTVITFASMATLPPRHAAAVGRAGFDLVVLYGSGADMLDGFLARERAMGRTSPAEHWIEHNAASYAQFSLPHHAAHRVTTYRDGRFIGAEALVAAVAIHLARRNPQWSSLVPPAGPGARGSDGLERSDVGAAA